MISGLIVSGALLFTTHQFWKENAVVITLDTMAVPVSEIPFPAVTVCESVDSVTRVEPWHLPMKIMDRLTFYCDKSGRLDRYLPNCDEAERNHEMFSPLKSYFYDNMKQSVQARISKNRNFTSNWHFSKHWAYIEGLVIQGKITMLDLHEINADRIGRLTHDPDKSPPLDAKGIQRLQEVIGTLLCNCQHHADSLRNTGFCSNQRNKGHNAGTYQAPQLCNNSPGCNHLLY